MRTLLFVESSKDYLTKDDFEVRIYQELFENTFHLEIIGPKVSLHLELPKNQITRLKSEIQTV